jgi:thioredoxin reductase
MLRFLPGLVLIVALVGSASLRSQQIPGLQPPYKNLQVFPKDTTGAVLVGAMKEFTRALGIRCEHCHVGEGDDLSKFDFAADTKPTKVTARKMLQMTAKLNDAVKDIGDPSTTPKITCFTCHRGAIKPATAAGGGT